MAEAHRRSDRRFRAGFRVIAAETVAAILSLLWIVAVGAYFLVFDTDAVAVDRTGFIVTLVAIFMPVAMIWIGAAAARSSRIMREESARLQAAIDAIRATAIAGQSAQAALRPTVERKLEEIARSARKTETALATFTSIRQTPDARRPASAAARANGSDTATDQAALALGAEEAPHRPVSVADFLRALNFPENENDAEGFRALRRALQDRQTAQLVTAAQEVLSLLAQDGIYMDDLTPDRARPELWRRFAAGERGRAVAGLGGIRDRTSLALSAGRMRQDPAFRDAVHSFLRRFDQMLVAFEPKATDAELAEMADTRTARAFMLLGRATGTFA